MVKHFKKSKAAKKSRPKKARACVSRMVPEVQAQISPNLAWVYPYLKKAKQKMPNLILPKYVRSYKPATNRIMRVLGNAYYESRVIVIATHDQVTSLSKRGKLRVNKLVRIPKTKLLETLAHEVAHLKYEEHGYEHEEYTRVIFKTFGIKEKCPTCRGSGKIDIDCKV